MAATPPDPPVHPPPHRRSVGFLQVDGQRWACFLVTLRTGHSRWKGHFAFRPSGTAEATDAVEVRTADIFVESTETEIERKARSMGRPLLGGLLRSALHVRGDEAAQLPSLTGPIRELLVDPDRLRPDPFAYDGGEVDEARLRSLYLSYRLDQVAHLVTLTAPEAFEAAVLRILQDARLDFSARDRTQLALLVVERLEGLLPLPPFDVWRNDYLADPAVYRVYAHRLHREGAVDD
jgi:hypothetical protein